MSSQPAPVKPRLLVVTHYFPAHRGGVEIVAGELASRLSQRFALRWLAADCDPAPSLPNARIEGQKAWNGLERFGLPWPLWGWHGWKTLYGAVGEADIIHLHDFIYPANIVAFCLARLRRKPVVITQHIGDIEYRNGTLRTVLRGVNRSLGRLMLGHADQTIFISPRVQTMFEGTGLFTLMFAAAVGSEGDGPRGRRDAGVPRAHPGEGRVGGADRPGAVRPATDRSRGLAAGSVDAIFMSDAYHHLEYPQHTLATLRAALRPGGTLWLIDFRRDEDSDEWLKQHVRAGKEVVLQELAAAGFVLVQEVPLLRENYFLKLQVR